MQYAQPTVEIITWNQVWAKIMLESRVEIQDQLDDEVDHELSSRISRSSNWSFSLYQNIRDLVAHEVWDVQ